MSVEDYMNMHFHTDADVSKFRDEVMATEYPKDRAICPWDSLEEKAKMIWRRDFAKHVAPKPPPPMPERDFILQQIDQLLKRLGEITKP